MGQSPETSRVVRSAPWRTAEKILKIFWLFFPPGVPRRNPFFILRVGMGGLRQQAGQGGDKTPN